MNRLINSPKQRNYLLIANVVALVAIFLPAVSLPLASISLATGTDGNLTLVMLILSLLTIFFAEEIEKILKTKFSETIALKLPLFFVTIVFGGILVRLAYIFQSIVFFGKKSDPFGLFHSTISTGIGLYITFFALIFWVLSLYLFSKTEDFVEKTSQKVKNFSQNNDTKTPKTEENFSEKNSEKTTQ